MTGLSVERFRPELAGEWNAFVADSKNGTFLLDRAYMDYHAHRFLDHSLLLRDGNQLVALLPANESQDWLHSHGGLTYGGLVLGLRSGAEAALTMFEALRDYMRVRALAGLHYKTIPSIYHRHPAEEDRYALFRLEARLTRRDVLSVVPSGDRIRYQERRARGVKVARTAGVSVAESTDFSAFWTVLAENLHARFGVDPVHSLGEISLLRDRFPESIRLFEATIDGRAVAGCVVFETHRVAHVQYISASERGKALHALDAVFDHLLRERYLHKPFFDFGISNEEAGRVLNAGLVAQKEGFGARTMVHDYYELTA